MSEVIVKSAPADVDLLESIRSLMSKYPPLVSDRPAIQVTVHDGVATITGHTQTANTRRYFLNQLGSIDGLKGVNADALFDDTSIRLEVSRLIPAGVQAIIKHGVVILAGEPPADLNIEALANQILQLPGVAKVVSAVGG